jgi:hypothetical protein
MYTILDCVVVDGLPRVDVMVVPGLPPEQIVVAGGVLAAC